MHPVCNGVQWPSARFAAEIRTFSRIGAAIGMTVDDVFTQGRRLWVRLLEKGGKHHELPCHHRLEEYLVAYIDGCDLRVDPPGPLTRTTHPAPGQRQ